MCAHSPTTPLPTPKAFKLDALQTYCYKADNPKAHEEGEAMFCNLSNVFDRGDKDEGEAKDN